MKEGWEYKKLGEVCDFEGGSQPPKSEWINHPQNGYVRMLQIRDFTKSRNAEIEYVKITKKLRLCKDDDILIGRYGASVGKILTGLAGAYNVAIIKSIPNEELIKKDFIRRYFESPLFQSILFKVCTSRAAQAGFSKDDIKDELIPLPPLSEQQRIVDYLDSAFAKIDAMKANAEKALNEAKALFQASLKEMLEPKEGWEEKALGELSDKIGDGLHGTPKYTDDGEYFFVNGNNLENGVIEIKDNTKRVNHDEYEKYKLDLNSSTVLLSINGTIGKTAFYNGEPIILGKSACYINVLPTLLKEYLRYYFVSDGFFNYVKSNSRQATITNLGLKEIRRMPLPTPSLDEQQSIVATLDSLKSKVDRLQENYDKISQECDALKQAILRQVFE